MSRAGPAAPARRLPARRTVAGAPQRA